MARKRGTETSLDALATPLLAALKRLAASPLVFRCFVIVEDTVTNRFVQFAVSDGERLLFDVPSQRLDSQTYTVPICKKNIGGAHEGVELAQAFLRNELRLPGNAVLRIREESTGLGSRPS